MIFGLNKKNLLKLKMWWDLLNERYLVMKNVDILMGFKMIKMVFIIFFLRNFYFIYFLLGVVY